MGKSKDLATGASTLYQTQTTSDTRYVNTAGDTMTGNLLLGSNSIGLGTTSPDEKLHVEGSILVDAFNAGNETGIFFREGFTSANKYNHSILAYDDDGSPDGISINGYGGVSICTGSNSRQERFKVDNSGYVTMPKQPAWVAYANSRTGWQTTSLQKTPYDSVLHAEPSSAFSTTNFRYTAPVAGRYWVQISQNGIGDIIIYIYKNGSPYHAGEYRSNPSGTWEHYVVGTVIELSVNDYVEAYVKLSTSSGYGWNGATSTWDQFSGFLIG